MSEVHGANPEKKDVVFKTGGGFTWKGLHPDLEPQDLPEDSPRQLTNMRLFGGRVESRGGQQLIQTLTGPVNGMTDYNTSYKPLIIMGTGQDLVNGVTYIASYDPTQSPTLQRVIVETLMSGLHGAMAQFEGDFYFCDRPPNAGMYASLYKLRTIKPPFGTESIDISAGNQAIKVFTLQPPYSRITALCVYENNLYIAVTDDIGTSSAIFKYDGVTAVLDTTFTYAVSAMGTYREKLIGFHNAIDSIDLIRVRNLSGVWSTVPGPGGAVPKIGIAGGTNKTKSYKDKLYFCYGYTGSSYTWAYFDGSAITDLRAASGIGAFGYVRSVEVFGGYLYFAWEDGANDTYIGRYDGTTWSPTFKRLTSQFGYGAPQAMSVYNGSLHACSVWNTLLTTQNLAISPGEDVAGTWTSIPLSFNGQPASISPISSLVM